jgi:hypothetical protein
LSTSFSPATAVILIFVVLKTCSPRVIASRAAASWESPPRLLLALRAAQQTGPLTLREIAAIEEFALARLEAIDARQEGDDGGDSHSGYRRRVTTGELLYWDQ